MKINPKLIKNELNILECIHLLYITLVIINFGMSHLKYSQMYLKFFL